MESNNKIDESFNFSEIEMDIVHNNRKAETKIGFAVLYKFFQNNGRFPYDKFEISNDQGQRPKTEDQRLKTRLSDFDILVDATPLGMKGPYESDSLFTADGLAGLKFVYDLVTKTTDTPLIAEAKKAGIPAIGGLDMLIAQGCKQFEIWTGHEAPAELMRDSLAARMAE